MTAFFAREISPARTKGYPICGLIVGVGEAGFLAPTSSLVSDHYPAQQRASAMSIIMLGSPLGNGMGVMAGGWIADTWGWRTAFLAMGVPGILIASLLLFLLREPPRGLADGAQRERVEPESFGVVLRTLFAKPTYVHLLLGAMTATFGLIAVGQFQMLFLVRSHGLSLTAAGAIQGVSVIVSLSLGTLLGGFGSDWAARRDRRRSLWLPAVGLVLATSFYLVGFLSSALSVSVVALLFGGMAMILFFSPTYAMAQNLAGPRMRATAVAVISTCSGIAGSGLGPTVLGLASDRYAAAIGGPHASGEGLRYALASVTIVFLWSTIHYLLAARTVRRDLYVAPQVP